MKSRFKIILPIYNCLTWLPRCFESINSQSYRGFDVVVVDDASTEAGQWEWAEKYCRDRGWLALRNEVCIGPLASQVRAIREAGCEDEDIIVRIDGDDWLAHDGVFAYLDEVYRTGRFDLTYGQYAIHPTGEVGWAAPYDAHVIENRLYRKVPIRWHSLQTFKAFLWNAIDDRDLRSPGGDYFRRAVDHAYMNPMLEMVGRRFCAIPDVLYIYNRENLSSITRGPVLPLEANVGYIRVVLSPYNVLDRCRK